MTPSSQSLEPPQKPGRFKHRPYWREQIQRCEVMLDEPLLPLQTLRIVRERMQEAQKVLRSIDKSPEKRDV